MKYRFKGLDKYVKQLENLSNSYNATVCVENAITYGSRIVREYTDKELKAMKPDDSPRKEGKRSGLRTIQKNFLIKEFGVSPIDDKRTKVNRKTGVDKGRFNYPDSIVYIPAVTLARMVEYGASYIEKNPVFSRASRKARKACFEAMQRSLTDDINFLTVHNNNRLKRREL